jgi:hypothetical protein
MSEEQYNNYIANNGAIERIDLETIICGQWRTLSAGGIFSA